MAQTINTNIASLNAQRNTSMSQSSLATSMQRLSSGLRVNSAKDDAAGLAIAERMNSQVRGMNVAIRNANDAISLSQTAEGAIGKLTDMAQRMRELAVQSANGTNTAADRTSLDAEYQQLAQEITRTIGATTFNGLAVLAGGAGPTDFQVGADAGQTVTVTTTDLSADATVTAVTGGDVTSAATASTAMITGTGWIPLVAASFISPEEILREEFAMSISPLIRPFNPTAEPSPESETVISGCWLRYFSTSQVTRRSSDSEPRRVIACLFPEDFFRGESSV